MDKDKQDAIDIFHGCVSEGGKEFTQKMLKAYSVQKRNAKQRGIDWFFTRASWAKMWAESGKIHERGLPGYVMSRFKDIGPYSTDNCEIISCVENTNQRQVREKIARSKASKGSEWKPKGNYRHLRNRAAHPKGKIVISPNGDIYENASLAADALGKTRACIAQRCRIGWNGWRYKD